MNKLILIPLLSGIFTFGQSEYTFTKLIDLSPTAVINQGKTGTCWSFATTSFLESEVKRMTGKEIDLSEMYNVRKTYPEKAYNYIYRNGKAQFSQGGLSHDVTNSVAKYGVVPTIEYVGMTPEMTSFDHSEMVKILSAQLDSIVKNPKKYLVSNWKNEFDATLNKYMGTPPEKFVYDGKNYTPVSFAQELKINPEDYITITSFTHHPFYSKFILEIPDNFSNGIYYNLPLDEYTELMKTALENGYSIALDTDVSEKTFSAEFGMAIWPSEGDEKDYFKILLPEKYPSQIERQNAFEDYSTTDDHLMHITGLYKDQIGNQYLDVKNSWGTKNLGNEGHVFMSIPYFQMKSIAYTVHKNALSPEVKKKLGIK